MIDVPPPPVNPDGESDLCVVCRYVSTLSAGALSHGALHCTANHDARQLFACNRIETVYSEALVEELGIKQLHCGHVYHAHCLRAWLQQQQTCPTCARPLAPVVTAPPKDQQIERDDHTGSAGANASAEPEATNLQPAD